jgi:hypothetical protein
MHACVCFPMQAPQWMVSQHNVRVHVEPSSEVSKGSKASAVVSGSGRHKLPALDGHSDDDGDSGAEEDDADLLDRLHLKKVSHSIVHSNERKQRRQKTGAGADE